MEASGVRISFPERKYKDGEIVDKESFSVFNLSEKNNMTTCMKQRSKMVSHSFICTLQSATRILHLFVYFIICVWSHTVSHTVAQLSNL